MTIVIASGPVQFASNVSPYNLPLIVKIEDIF